MYCIFVRAIIMCISSVAKHNFCNGSWNVICRGSGSGIQRLTHHAALTAQAYVRTMAWLQQQLLEHCGLASATFAFFHTTSCESHSYCRQEIAH